MTPATEAGTWRRLISGETSYINETGTTIVNEAVRCLAQWALDDIAEAVAAERARIAAAVRALPNSGGGHLDTAWNDAFGQMQHWHECAYGSGLDRAAVIAIVEGREP